METNFVGTVAVTQAMLPLLQTTGKAQILNVSSELGCISRHLLRPYEADRMKASACNPAVGNVKNNGPEMLNSA